MDNFYTGKSLLSFDGEIFPSITDAFQIITCPFWCLTLVILNFFAGLFTDALDVMVDLALWLAVTVCLSL